MAGGWISIDNKAKKVKNLFVGVNGKARKVVRGYVGINGVAKKIYPQGVIIPSVSGSYTYNGSSQTVQLAGVDSDLVTISGTTSAINAGTYTVTASLRYPYLEWTDGTTSNKTISWTIEKKTIPYPRQKSYSDGRYLNIYTGETKSPQWYDYDPSIMYYSYYPDGRSGAENVGTYYLYFHIYDSAYNNYQFPDGGQSKKVEWRISQALLEQNLPESTWLKVGDTEDRMFRLTNESLENVGVSESNVTRESSDPSILTIVDSGAHYIRVRGVSEGDAIIRTTITPTDNYKAQPYTYLPAGRLRDVTIQVRNN